MIVRRGEADGVPEKKRIGGGGQPTVSSGYSSRLGA